MPDLREGNGHRGEERADGRKRYADFRGLVLEDQVRGKFLENMLKLVRALSRVIGSTRHIRNLLQRRLVIPPAKPAAPKLPATSKLLAAAKRVTILTSRAAKRVEFTLGSKPDGVDTDSTVGGLLRGLRRQWTHIARPIGE